MRSEVVCDAISKTYEGGKRALSSIRFTVPTQGIFSLIGRNGAGKTTLARILSTLLEPTEGRATIDGLDVMNDADALRERMSIIPQEGRAVPWMTPKQTVSSYLLWRGLSFKEAGKKAEEAIAQVGLQDQTDRLNRTLSGGMRRKVLVAMVIASEAEFIFLDEPSTGLDPISREELWGILTELAKSRFLLLTTHYLEEAEAIADRIGILEEGKLLAMGSMGELRKNLSYEYSIQMPRGTSPPSVEGEVIVRKDGQVQIMTTETEALRIANKLIEQGGQFSVNPVTLEEIFYHAVAGQQDEIS